MGMTELFARIDSTPEISAILIVVAVILAIYRAARRWR
jgi:hypothetical protein